MPIEFLIVDLMSSQSSYEWLLAYFHPEGMSCMHCGGVKETARKFRVTKSSQVPDYRCRRCDKTYNVYSGTVKGEQAQTLANEVGICRQTVQEIRHAMQANAQAIQPENP